MDPLPRRPLLFPESPSFERWARLSPDERVRYYASIPQDPPPFDVAPPEGLAHDRPTRRALEALEQYFRRRGRSVFLASNLRVIYPDEGSFAPDLMAVTDVQKDPDDEMPAWVVAAEGRGLDFALEVHVAGDRRKDAVENVARYARLGIPEYFFFDRPRWTVHGWHLPSPDARTYRRLLPQFGKLHSEILDLDIGIADGRLRFFSGTAELPAAGELIARLDTLVAGLETRLEEEARAHDEEARLREAAEGRREDEQRRREEAEKRLAEVTAELERLRRDKG